MEEKTFVIDLGSELLPVNYSHETLESFGKKAAGAMDKEIRMISDDFYGREFYLTRANRLGVLAPLIYHAVELQDNDRVLLCVLWLATNFPEITGVALEDGLVEYLQEEPLDPRLVEFERPEYLN